MRKKRILEKVIFLMWQVKIKMNTNLLISILLLLILLLMPIGCDDNKSQTSPDEMKYPLQLTSSCRDGNPYISPDGEHIAFLSLRNTYNPAVAQIIYELWILDKDGSNQHPLISFDEFDKTITVQSVSWAKDSSHMLVEILIIFDH